MEINREVSKEKLEVISAVYSNYKDMIALVDKEKKVYIGKIVNYHFDYKDNVPAYYDNRDNSLIWLSDNDTMFSFLYSTGWVLSQKEMLKYFTMKDYYEFDMLQKEVLLKYDRYCEVKFRDVPFKSPKELLEEVDLDKYVGKKISAYEDIYQFSTGKKKYTRGKSIGIILGYNDEKVDFYDRKNPGNYKYYSVDKDKCKEWLFEGSYKINYNPLTNDEKEELKKYNQEKVKSSEELEIQI